MLSGVAGARRVASPALTLPTRLLLRLLDRGQGALAQKAHMADEAKKKKEMADKIKAGKK